MKTIYKYVFSIDDTIDLNVPEGAEFLAVQMQRGQPCVWAIVTPGAPRETRVLRLRGTGHAMQGNEGRHVRVSSFRGCWSHAMTPDTLVCVEGKGKRL